MKLGIHWTSFKACLGSRVLNCPEDDDRSTDIAIAAEDQQSQASLDLTAYLGAMESYSIWYSTT